ncbi:hypothetical protein GCM10017710_01690 [Arthrobacter ramosus]
MAALEPLKGNHRFARFVQVPKKVSGHRKKNKTGLGQHNSLAHSMEKGRCEFAFQSPDALRERRLADVQHIRRGGETPRIC